MNKFYFNTGVVPHGHNPPIPLCKGQVWLGGTKQIPFDADAPEDAELLFLCDNPDLPESKLDNVIVREVSNTSMVSRFAYFQVSG
jgi:hypothetical protein